MWRTHLIGEYLEGRGLTVEKFAKSCGVRASKVRRLMRGENINMDDVAKIILGIGVSMEYFVGRTEIEDLRLVWRR